MDRACTDGNANGDLDHYGHGHGELYGTDDASDGWESATAQTTQTQGPKVQPARVTATTKTGTEMTFCL